MSLRIATAEAFGAVGSVYILSQTTGATIAAATGKLSGGTTTQYSVTGVVRRPKLLEIDGALVQREDLFIRVRAYGLPVRPLAGDTLSGSHKTYRVVGVAPKELAGQTLDYELQVRGA